MRTFLFILFFILFPNLYAQDGFIMSDNKSKVIIPFQFLSNLIFVDVAVNGVDLTFLLDTGVAETVLFTLDEDQILKFENAETIQLKGMGSQKPIDALIAKNNRLVMKDFADHNHDILIVLNQDVNFSPNVGIPVNGILGSDFFRNYPVEIDYQRKRIIIRKSRDDLNRRLKKFESFPMKIFNDKPYLDIIVKSGASAISASVLIDSGNSDALWLFAERNDAINIPENSIVDFLGRGLSGDIFGRKGRIAVAAIGTFTLPNIITSFPDSISSKNVTSDIERLGSIGGEVLRRFKQIFDYQQGVIYLKPNKYFEEEFLYDKSGIEVQHDGLEWIREQVAASGYFKGDVFDRSGEKISNNFVYKFGLKPIYKVFNVRISSSAEEAGIKINDQLLKINGRSTYRMSLDQINNLLRGTENKMIKVELMRGGKILTLSFPLRKIL